MADEDLEALAPEGVDDFPAPSTGARPRRVGRWPFLVAGGLAVCLLAGVWIHRTLLTSELTFLSRQWDGAQLLVDRDGANAVGQLRLSSGTTAYTTSLVSAAYRQEAAELGRVRVRLHGRVLVDPALAGLRHSMLSALDSEQRDLGREAEFWLHFPDGAEPASITTASLGARAVAESRLAAALRRFHVARPAPGRATPGNTPPTTPARPAPVADGVTSASLLVATPGALELVDIDGNTITRLPSAVDPSLEVVQTMDLGPTVVVRAAAPDGEGELIGLRRAAPGVGIRLGRVALDQALLAGDRAGRVIARRPDGSVIELDDQFNQVAGPLAVPDIDHLIGLAPAGVVLVTPPASQVGVLAGPGTIEVLDPARLGTVRRVVGDGEAFALCGDNLIWGAGFGQAAVYVTDLATGRQRNLYPGQAGLVAVGAPWNCSPDGTRVAGVWSGLITGAPASSVSPAVIDLASGAVQLTSDGFASQPDASNIAWTPDGARIFLAGNPGPNRGPDVVTFRPGDRQVTHLRIPGLVLAFCPVTVSPG